MKLSEIKVGGDYAVKKYGTHYRMRAVEVGEFTYRQFRGNWDYKGQVASARGVKMQHIGANGTATDNPPEWVRAQQVSHVWATEVQQIEAHRRVQAARDIVVAQLNEALKTAGCKYASGYANRETGYITVSLSSSDAATLTAALTAPPATWEPADG